MKRDALIHPKTLDFASRLDITRSHAIGILTLLFDFTATYSPRGDIGKHRDGAIARGCDWNGNPEEFILALVESGWIDLNSDHRLIIHDWPDHCEQWVKLKLQKLKSGFLDAYSKAEAIAEPTATTSTAAAAEVSASRDLAKPSLAKPSLDQASPPIRPVAERVFFDIADYPGFVLLKDEAFVECWLRWERKFMEVQHRVMDFSTRQASLKKLQTECDGVADAMASVEHCILYCKNIYPNKHKTVKDSPGGGPPKPKTNADRFQAILAQQGQT